MSKKVKLDKFHYHEALDRTDILINMISHLLSEHPVIKTDNDLKEHVYDVLESLSDIYQYISDITPPK